MKKEGDEAKRLGCFTTTRLKFFLISPVLVLKASLQSQCVIHVPCFMCDGFIEPQRLDRMQNTLEVILLMEENAPVVYMYIYTCTLKVNHHVRKKVFPFG